MYPLFSKFFFFSKYPVFPQNVNYDQTSAEVITRDILTTVKMLEIHF